MAKRHRKARKTPAPKKSSSAGWLRTIVRLPSWAMVCRAGIAAMWLVFFGCLAFGWAVFLPALQVRATSAAAQAAAELELQFVAAPEWFKGEICDSVVRTASLQLSRDPFQRDELVAVREALMTTGWFEEVHQVRRAGKRLVQVEARFVRPHAVIRDKQGDHLVDLDGKLLPKSYKFGEAMPQAQVGETRLPAIAIVGSHFPRPQRPGQKWEGADISAALNLLSMISGQPWRHQVIAIDVAGVMTRNEPMRIRTSTGGTILWGSPPGEEQALELFAEAKLKRLSYMHQTDGRIDLGHPGEIDITKSVGVSAR